MTQIKSVASKIANSNGIVTVNEFCSMYIPRYGGRLHDLKKMIGIDWEYSEVRKEYSFSPDTIQKCKEFLIEKIKNKILDEASTRMGIDFTKLKPAPEYSAPIGEQAVLF